MFFCSKIYLVFYAEPWFNIVSLPSPWEAHLNGQLPHTLAPVRKNLFRKIARSTAIALGGFRLAYQHDESFKLEINVGIPLYVLLLGVLFPLSAGELALVTGSFLLVLILELVNTAIERAIDAMNMRHELFAMSKDVASSAVFLAFCWCFACVAYVVGTHEQYWFLR